MRKVKVASWDELGDRVPAHALVEGVDLVVVRYDEEVSVLYGRCLHRGALLSDGTVQGEDLVCGLHGWDFRYDTGISAYDNGERLPKFAAWREDGAVLVDADEVRDWERENPQPYRRDDYLGAFADVHGTPEEPHTRLIQDLARNGLERTGHHGPVSAMGVAGPELPRWDDLQFVTAQLARPPRLDEEPVATELVVGPRARKPLVLDIPLFVSE